MQKLFRIEVRELCSNFLFQSVEEKNEPTQGAIASDEIESVLSDADKKESKEIPPDDEFYKEVHEFFTNLSLSTPKEEIVKKISSFMERDIIKTMLYAERNLEGDRISVKQMIEARENFDKMVKQLAIFKQENKEEIKKFIQETKDFDELVIPGDEAREKKEHFAAVVLFCRKHFKYSTEIKGDFIHTLSDVSRNEKIRGDCNEISTLHVALYGSKYPLKDFTVDWYKLSKNTQHAAITFFNKKFEATSGEFIAKEDVDFLNSVPNTNHGPHFLLTLASTDEFGRTENVEKDFKVRLLCHYFAPGILSEANEDKNVLESYAYNFFREKAPSIEALEEFKDFFGADNYSYKNLVYGYTIKNEKETSKLIKQNKFLSKDQKQRFLDFVEKFEETFKGNPSKSLKKIRSNLEKTIKALEKADE